MRQELEQARRENKLYIKNVEQGKMLETMAQRRLKKRERMAQEAEGRDVTSDEEAEIDGQKRVRQKFRQREAVRIMEDREGGASAKGASTAMKNVLGKIF